MTGKRCGTCLFWDGPNLGHRIMRLCDNPSHYGRDDTPACHLFRFTTSLRVLEAAVREAGLEELYVGRLLSATGIETELWVSNVDGEGELTNAIQVVIALAALTEAQRAQAARETLEEAP